MSVETVTDAVHWPAADIDRPFGGLLKRLIDLALVVPALIFLAPLLAVMALAVKVQDGGPALFVQPRVGRDGRLFACFKFRSMVVDAEQRLERLLREDPQAACEWREKQKLTRDPRVTAVGRFLRASSVDELPQLINILIGDMSIVGPRPMLPEQIDQYGPGFARYCTARPGLTGLWQVSGRSETSFRRRSELDQIYLRGWSLATDVGLLARTVDVVLRKRGAC